MIVQIANLVKPANLISCASYVIPWNLREKSRTIFHTTPACTLCLLACCYFCTWPFLAQELGGEFTQHSTRLLIFLMMNGLFSPSALSSYHLPSTQTNENYKWSISYYQIVASFPIGTPGRTSYSICLIYLCLWLGLLIFKSVHCTEIWFLSLFSGEGLLIYEQINCA